MKKNLDTLLSEKDGFDKESQAILNNLNFRRAEISKLSALKNNEGWQIMDKKIRDEVKIRITEMVKDDPKIQTLLALLASVDIKNMNEILQSEIDGILPE